MERSLKMNDNDSIVSLLQEMQEREGYIPKDEIYRIAEAKGVSPAKVMGVATFYSQFRLTKPGKNMILLCKGTACHVNSADGIATALKEELGIGDGETSEDGLFTIEFVACLGCCSLSPVMMINGVAYGSLTPEKAKAIVREIRDAALKGS
jgi:NADH-quinone oxidoreductase subunit E